MSKLQRKLKALTFVSRKVINPVFLGEGESGCVLRPHIPCSVKTPRNTQTVGKIMKNNEEFHNN